jgi:hypothetical protein
MQATKPVSRQPGTKRRNCCARVAPTIIRTIVLADYQMDDMDEAALGERGNSIRICRARIVILTSLMTGIRRFASLGFAGGLMKPVRARSSSSA